MPHAQLGFSTRQVEVQNLFEQVQSDARKVEAYDRARSRVKIEGNTRAEYVLRIEALEEQLEASQAALHRPETVAEKPDGWPEKCGVCGADWAHIGFDYADGFNCRACGRADSDE